MDITEQKIRRELIAKWLDNPGTQFIIGRLHEAAEEAAKQYDHAVISGDRDKVLKIAITRWFINEELPRIIETIMNSPRKPNTPNRWAFWNWFNLRCRKHDKGEAL